MIVYDERFLEHRQADPDHPERPERLTAITGRLRELGLWREVEAPAPAAPEALGRVHTAAYLRRLAASDPRCASPDTAITPGLTFDLARLSAGGALLAARTAWRERRATLALLRPPGHHARPDEAMGFCYLNNIAVAAADLAAAGAGRLAIVDIDVHHGNGTSEMFYDRDDILFVSLHQHPLYPGTGAPGALGAGAGLGFNLDLPLPAGSGDAAFDAAWERVVEPVLRQFRPAMILVSLGTDAHARDPLAGLTLSSAGYLRWTQRLLTLAGELCQRRLCYILEGGYDLASLAEVVAGAAAQIVGDPGAAAPEDHPVKSGDLKAPGLGAVEAAVAAFRPFWRL